MSIPPFRSAVADHLAAEHAAACVSIGLHSLTNAPLHDRDGHLYQIKYRRPSGRDGLLWL